jgi:hypothetical protein
MLNFLEKEKKPLKFSIYEKILKTFNAKVEPTLVKPAFCVLQIVE